MKSSCLQSPSPDGGVSNEENFVVVVAIFAVLRSFKAPRQVLPVIGVVSLSVFRKFQAPSSGNRPLRHAVCGAASTLRADIAPPLARFCSEGGRWAGGQSSAAHPSPHHPSVPAAPSVMVHTFLPCSMVTAPRVAFVVPLLMPTARSSLGALVIGGGGGASSSCYRRVW